MAFDVALFEKNIVKTANFLKNQLPKSFIPKITLTLGSGGLGEISQLIENKILELPYSKIPGFTQTTVVGHEGKLIFGYINQVPVMILKGRTHFYEIGTIPDQVTALKQITFPVYVAHQLGSKIYFATNACGGLNPKYKTGDIMIIKSHVSIFYPNPLLGPNISWAQRFPPQNNQYDPKLRNLLLRASKLIGQERNIHEGVFCGLTGPTYESQAESLILRKLSVDTVSMSTIPEIIVATSLGMKTLGLSLVTNVIAKDGTNATSHQEVMSALNDIKTKKRILNLFANFFRLFSTQAM